MSCEFVKESLTGYIDDRLTEPARRQVALHLASCGECAGEHARSTQLRRGMRALRSVPAPARLITDLRILASKEIVRRRRMSRFPGLADWMDRVRLFAANLMRPMALPFAGGLTSALCIFGMLIPSLCSIHNTAHETPSALYTEASVDTLDDFSSSSKTTDTAVVEVQVDGQGHMVDYNVIEGKMTGELGNLLLFSTFKAATVFLQPTAGKVVIRRSRIVVKG